MPIQACFDFDDFEIMLLDVVTVMQEMNTEINSKLNFKSDFFGRNYVVTTNEFLLN